MRVPRAYRAWLSPSCAYLSPSYQARCFSSAPCRLSEASLPFPLSENQFASLRHDMMSRNLPVLFDVPTSTPLASLESTLKDSLPEAYTPIRINQRSSRRFTVAGRTGKAVPFGMHLVFFPPQTTLSELLQDATDPAQSPGAPFDRRMWAGGKIELRPLQKTYPSNFCRGVDFSTAIAEESACVERIVDVSLKGTDEKQKLFVKLERRIGSMARMGKQSSGHASLPRALPAKDLNQHRNYAFYRRQEHVKEWLMRDENCAVVETRNLVFMNAAKLGAVNSVSGDAAQQPSKVLKASHAPDHSVTLTPSAAMLFRFSALTFNAHRIHLDKLYCRDVEGHRDLLVHGPLSCLLMIETLRGHLEKENPLLNPRARIEAGFDSKTAESDKPPLPQMTDFEYRNLAPLYAEEEMRVCLRKKSENAGVLTYELWVENAEGSMCVKGTMTCEMSKEWGLPRQTAANKTRKASGSTQNLEESRKDSSRHHFRRVNEVIQRQAGETEEKVSQNADQKEN